MPSRASPSHSSTDTLGLRYMVLAEAFTRAQCWSRSGATPSNTLAPSNTDEPSQMACVRAPHNGTLPSRHCPSKNVQVVDQPSLAAIHVSVGYFRPASHRGLASITSAQGGYYAWNFRIRRLWHAVRCACGDPALRAGRARCRAHVGDLAQQTARIHMDADAGRALRRLLDTHRARTRFCAGTCAGGEQGPQTKIDGCLFPA